MNIRLEAPTRANWEDCIELELRPEQEDFVASNLYSLAQASMEPECVPLVVFDEDEMVGFVMYAHDRDDGRWWIYRLMIDAAHQGKGYGAAALARTIEHIRKASFTDRVVLGIRPDNDVARRLYLRAGFVPTGEVIGGEDILEWTAATPG